MKSLRLSANFSPRLDAHGGRQVFRGCGERFNAVILSEAKDPGSSRPSVNTPNYGGSLPKMRAQNDSAYKSSRNNIALRDALE